MVGKSLLRSMLLWGLLWIVSLYQQSPGLCVVRADSIANEAKEEALLGRTEALEPQQVCVPADPVDCSKHEQSIRELTDSLEALQGTLEDVRTNAAAAQQTCQLQVEEIRADHQAQLDEMEQKLADAIANRQIDTHKDAKKEEAMAELQRAFEALQAQYDFSLTDREELKAQLENTAQQLRELLQDHEAQIREVARVQEAFTKRKLELQQELQSAQSKLEKSQQALFETRQELHDIWEQYVTIRDAWWNVPTRYYAFVKFCARQWRKVDDRVTKFRAAIKPYVEQAGHFVGTCVLAVRVKVTVVVHFAERMTFDWFLPKWRLYVQPRLNQVGRFLAEQAAKLSVVAKEHGHKMWEWAGQKGSEFSEATAPQRERVAHLVQPTVAMLRAQFVPAWTAIQGAWNAARTKLEDSNWLESALSALHKVEVRIVSWCAAASRVAHDYLVLQNAPEAVTEPLLLFYNQATWHVTSGPRNVALAAATTALALMLALMWLVPTWFRRPTKQRQQQSYAKSPERTYPKQPQRPKPSSPDLVTEASSSTVPGASSVRTPGTSHR